jgi:hypothetical protein
VQSFKTCARKGLLDRFSERLIIIDDEDVDFTFLHCILIGSRAIESKAVGDFR